MSSPRTAALRSHALTLMSQGRSVQEVAAHLGLAEQTVHRWHRGIAQSTLAQAQARIEKLEGEIAACRQVIDLMKEAVPPKDATR